MEDSKIILPGDPNWNPPAEVSKPAEKLPDELIETVFREVIDEVKTNIIDAEPVLEEELPKPVMPKVAYRFCSPSRTRSYNIPVQEIVKATLTEDLPLSWERICHVGRIVYGPNGKERLPGFKKGEEVTLNSCTLFPGVGLLYGFAEGSRGGYGLRPDQIIFVTPSAPVGESNGTVDVGQGPDLQQARPTEDTE